MSTQCWDQISISHPSAELVTRGLNPFCNTLLFFGSSFIDRTYILLNIFKVLRHLKPQIANEGYFSKPEDFCLRSEVLTWDSEELNTSASDNLTKPDWHEKHGPEWLLCEQFSIGSTVRYVIQLDRKTVVPTSPLMMQILVFCPKRELYICSFLPIS